MKNFYSSPVVFFRQSANDNAPLTDYQKILIFALLCWRTKQGRHATNRAAADEFLEKFDAVKVDDLRFDEFRDALEWLAGK